MAYYLERLHGLYHRYTHMGQASEILRKESMESGRLPNPALEKHATGMVI